MGRPKTKSPFDPPNPRTIRGRQLRERAVKEVLFWENYDSPKREFMEELEETESRSNYKPKVVKLSAEDMETVYDINRLWEIGTFRYIPEAVAERLLADHIIGNFGKLKDGNVSFDTIADPNNPISIPHNILTRMGLEVLRLYLMGVDPYMRAVVRRVIASNGETLHLKRIMYGVSHSAIAMNNDYELEDDDDFDFSSIDGLDF